VLNSLVFSLCLEVLSGSTSFQLSEKEFHVVVALTENYFDDKASDV